jgi:hypothetical protein
MIGGAGNAGRLGSMDAMGSLRHAGRLDAAAGRRAIDAAGSAAGEASGGAQRARGAAGDFAPQPQSAPLARAEGQAGLGIEGTLQGSASLMGEARGGASGSLSLGMSAGADARASGASQAR